MRLAAKTATYGLMHVAIAFCVAWAVSGDIHVALAISLLEPFVQIFFFSIHEYIWNKTHPGVPSPHHNCAGTGTHLRQLMDFVVNKIRRG